MQRNTAVRGGMNANVGDPLSKFDCGKRGEG